LGDVSELYDLKADPYELHNLADDRSSRSRMNEMRAELNRLLKETDYQPAEAARPAR
jgi:arylsulfatase A-like enzyme